MKQFFCCCCFVFGSLSLNLKLFFLNINRQYSEYIKKKALTLNNHISKSQEEKKYKKIEKDHKNKVIVFLLQSEILFSLVNLKQEIEDEPRLCNKNIYSFFLMRPKFQKII